MALRVTRSAALFLAAVVLNGCAPGSSFFGPSASVNVAGQSQTGTATVRGRIQQLRSDQNALAAGLATQRGQLDTTRNQMQSDTSSYQSLVQAITSHLQRGTTPGNPDLVTQWNEAQAKLDAVTLGVGQLNSLASQVTTQASVAGYLIDNVRATYNVGGATDDDHSQLRAIESESGRSIQEVDRLIGDLNAEIGRENGFLGRERSNLAALSYGINVGRLGAPRGGPGGGGNATGMPRRVVTAPASGSPPGSPTQLSAAQR
jgi:hypothetical protein